MSGDAFWELAKRVGPEPAVLATLSPIDAYGTLYCFIGEWMQAVVSESSGRSVGGDSGLWEEWYCSLYHARRRYPGHFEICRLACNVDTSSADDRPIYVVEVAEDGYLFRFTQRALDICPRVEYLGRHERAQQGDTVVQP